MGVERLFADQEDLLPDFFQLLSPCFDHGLQPKEDCSWPNALVVPGWRHAWDLILQKGLCSLRWFPGWLSKLKAIVGFFRLEGNRVVVVRSLRARGGFPTSPTGAGGRSKAA